MESQNQALKRVKDCSALFDSTLFVGDLVHSVRLDSRDGLSRRGTRFWVVKSNDVGRW